MLNYKEFILGTGALTEETLTEATKYSFKKDVESVSKKFLAIKGEKLHDWMKTEYFNLGEIREAQIHFSWESVENKKLAQERREVGYEYEKLGPLSSQNDKLAHELRKKYDDCQVKMQKNRNAHLEEVRKMFGLTWKDKRDLVYLKGSVESNEVAISDTLTMSYKAQFREDSLVELVILRHKKEEGVETEFKEFPECKVGAVYCSQWGYRMVRVDFFEVVGRTGSTVMFKQLKIKETEEGFLRGHAVPIKGKYVNNAIFKTKVSNPRAFGRSYMPMVIWDGKPKQFDYND